MEARHVHRYTLHNIHTHTHTHLHLVSTSFDHLFTLFQLVCQVWRLLFSIFAPDSFHSCFIFQVGGQCRCKIAVSGRQCSRCLPGWYGLEASNPEGCARCNCTDVGIASNSSGVPTCNQDTGQCRCKAHVIGRQTSGKEFWNYIMEVAGRGLWFISSLVGSPTSVVDLFKWLGPRYETLKSSSCLCNLWFSLQLYAFCLAIAS